jgi:peroxisomal 2,4-dienoyl-CoA reductase
LKSEGIDAAFDTGDVRRVDDVQKVVDNVVHTFGSLSILINSAAGNFLAVAEELSPKGMMNEQIYLLVLQT